MGYLFRHSTLPFSVEVVLLIVIHLLIDVAWDVAAIKSQLSVWQWLGVALAVCAVILLQTVNKHAEPNAAAARPAKPGRAAEPGRSAAEVSRHHELLVSTIWTFGGRRDTIGDIGR